MLIDEMINILERYPEYDISQNKIFTKTMIFATRFRVTNIYRYILQHWPEGTPFDGEKELPNVSPFSMCAYWFEYTRGGAETVGVLVTVDFIRDGEQSLKWQNPEHLPLPETQWILRMQCFGKTNHDYRIFQWINYYHINKDGRILSISTMNSEDGPIAGIINDPSIDVAPSSWYFHFVVPLMSLCFLHCKGIVLEEETFTRQIRRNAERMGKTLIPSFRIGIDTLMHTLDTEGNITQNGIKKALHICRGHFANYTEENPLFGKYVGTVFRPMHVRGKNTPQKGGK